MRDQRPNYDYLLAVGPGRSGTTFFYRNLRLHPQFALPEIKEAGYYRSPRRFLKESQALGEGQEGQAQVLADVSNLACQDDLLGSKIAALKGLGVRVLLVVLLREHRERARSMFRYRKSRGHLAAWLGASRLEQSVVRDRLRPERLDEIYRIGVDVLCIDFSALASDPARVFRHLSGLCGVAVPERVERRIPNQSVRSRHLALSSLARIGAALLRALGHRRLLQRLKESGRLARLFFLPMSEKERKVALKDENLRLLQRAFADCTSVIEAHSAPLAEGLYFCKAGGSQ